MADWLFFVKLKRQNIDLDFKIKYLNSYDLLPFY